MKKLLVPTLVILAALNLSGCVILHSATEIAADGSGTMTMSVSMSETVQQGLREMKELDGGQSGDMDFPMFEDITKDKLAAAGKDWGVKIDKFDKSTADGRQSLEIALSFKDLKGFSYVMGHIMGDASEKGGLGIFDAGDGNLVLRQTEYDFPDVPAEEEAEDAAADAPAEMDPEKMGKQMEIMGKMMSALAELDVKMEVTVPGDIVSTNAPQTEGRTSIWTINSTNMMSAEANMDPEVVFSGKGLKIKPLKE